MRSELIAAALERYARTEPAIHAWVAVDPQAPLASGPLDGMPFGVKDIFETAALPTEFGSALHAGRKGACDAAIVTRLRELGGVLFGKTQTAAFAYFDPPPTRNPRNLAHTPGGSSSGSAAAVAAGVVPFALGTQTMGSILRPASFCGIAGFKPTFGTLPFDGVLAFAPSLDTTGLLAESAATIARVWRALGFSAGPGAAIRFGVPEPLPPVSPEMGAAFRRSARELGAESVRLPVPYEEMLAAARLVNAYEGARTHYGLWRQFGDRIGERLAELVVRGMGIPEQEYHSSLGLLRTAAETMDSVFAEFPVLLTPAAPGEAPAGLASTGDPAMNAVWTALGVPAVSIPMPVRGGLPLGMQIVTRRGDDGMLLSTAGAVEARFAAMP